LTNNRAGRTAERNHLKAIDVAIPVFPAKKTPLSRLPPGPIVPFNWKRRPPIGGSVTTPAARRVGLGGRLQPGSVKQTQTLAYLRAWKRPLQRSSISPLRFQRSG
jgi:hypothetical protein